HSPAGANLVFSTRREAKSGGRSVIKRVMPRQNEAVNEIWISDRDRFAHHFVNAPDRLKKPLVRKNGKLVEASWDEALDLVAGKLKGAETAVSGLSGDRLSNEDLFLFQKLIRKLGSNDIDLGNRRLAGGDVVAKVGISSGSNLGELGTGDAIVVFASDLHEEVPLWWLRVKQAAERGAKLVVLNLRKTRLDKYAAHTIQYGAGDAVSTLRQLVNAAKVETSGSENEIDAAAEALIQAKNLVAFYGAEGLNYAETNAAARLLANLLLIKGEETHAGQTNNGLIPVWPHNNTQGAWDMGVHPAFAPGYKAVANPGKDAAAIYAGAQSGDVSTLFVLGTDPVGDGLMADRGKLDFLVVQELFLTETAKLADVVLPAQSWAEREGTFTSGERRIQRYYPGVQPLGKCRADWQILAQIGERVGLGKPAFAASLVFRDVAKAVPQYKGIDYRTLAQVEPQWPNVGGADLYYGGTSYENRAGLGQQWKAAAESGDVEALEVAETAVSPSQSLQLVRTAALYTPGTLICHSNVLAPRMAQPILHLNEADADGIATGDKVAVTVNKTTIEAVADVNGTVPAGLALLRGVPYMAGTAVVESLTKLEQEETV
ncbi:MAG: molybdopterin-dependent oxidoreductase, partial [Chloroflexi bacterium]|nr:molybdopterin-dependent oxidoreductase [Chloroflexota bacterium]